MFCGLARVGFFSLIGVLQGNLQDEQIWGVGYGISGLEICDAR